MTATLEWIAADGSVTSLSGGEIDALQGVEGLDIADVENTWEQRASFDGAALTRSRVGVRPILLPLFIEAEDPQVVLRDLMRKFKAGPGQLRATLGSTVRILREVSFESATDTRDGSNAVANWRKIVVSLVAGDPWWYSVSSESQVLELGVATLSDDATVDSDDPAVPSNGGGTTLVTVGGDTSAFPFVVVDGPFSALTVVNATASASMTLAAPLLTGERLYVDGRPGQRGPRMDGGRVDWSLLTSASRLFSLARGSNALAVSSDGTTGDSRVEVRWIERHATP